jgi:CIC family chloride channel protein
MVTRPGSIIQNPGKYVRISAFHKPANCYTPVRNSPLPPTTKTRYEDKVLLLLTLVIGAIVGVVVVAFILLTENLGARLYPAHGAAWRRLVIPVFGSLIAGFLLARYFPNARGSGIPQTKVALFIRDGFIAMRTVLGKFGLSSITLASGIALGREGPSVQVGAGIASVLGRKLGLSQSSVKALLPVGASAALAAAFNTPIAAVLFSLEEVMGDMHAPVLGSIVLSSATSWIVLHLLLGDEPLFHVPPYQLVHPIEFLIYAVLGVVGGLVSVGFVKFLLWQRKRFLAMPKSTVPWQPVVGGLTVGILGWFFPGVLGVGYNVVGQALNGEMMIRTMALLVLLKLVATATCYASGNAGGIFGPSLFLGAMMGGAVGGVAHTLLPDYTGSVGAYALVGMGAAFAGIIRVPLTSVIMIFEITRDYSIIVPLMIANLLSYFISSRLQEDPIYEALQHQDGIHLPSGARAREAFLMVGQAMRTTPAVLPATLQVAAAAASIKREDGAWPVMDEQGLRGMLSATQLDRAEQDDHLEETLGQLVPAPDMRHDTPADFPHLHADHTLDTAMRRIAETGLPVIPVVSRTNLRELNGVISMADIMSAYRLGNVPAPPGPEPLPVSETPAGKPIAFLAGVLAVLIAIAVLGGFLSYYYRAQRSGRAQRFYERGNALLGKDLYESAIAEYREALSLSQNSRYRLALALALAKAGHLNEATIYLKELLRTEPASAPANLGMARVAAQEGSVDEALSYYHRAIDGVWPATAVKPRIETRLELVQMLGNAGQRQHAQAELLSLLAARPPNLDQMKREAPLLLQYGLPKEAVGVFHEIINRDPQDESAWAGLGEAEYALADYPAASDALQSALKLNPNDTAAQKHLEASGQIVALDPTRRGLGAIEKFHRSQKLLSGVLDAATQCPLPSPSPAPNQRIDAARKSLANQSPPSFSDAAEKNVTLAEELWKAAPTSCASWPPPDSPLARVMAKLIAR